MITSTVTITITRPAREGPPTCASPSPPCRWTGTTCPFRRWHGHPPCSCASRSGRSRNRRQAAAWWRGGTWGCQFASRWRAGSSSGRVDPPPPLPPKAYSKRGIVPNHWECLKAHTTRGPSRGPPKTRASPSPARPRPRPRPRTILYYTILYYTILYYTILYYTILYYTILYYTVYYISPEPGAPRP